LKQQGGGSVWSAEAIVHEPELLEGGYLDPPVTGSAANGQCVLEIGNGFDQPALLAVEPA
jgi:hypothetical protein